jgi:hypothetical protein
MKTIVRANKSRSVAPAFVAGVFLLVTIPAMGEGTNSAAGPVLKPIPKSVFIIPTAPVEGRDPFFPNSTRAPGSVQPEKQVHTDSAPSLFVLNGLTLSQGSPMAIINGRTIAVGETGPIPTSGGDVSVHLIEIKNNTSVVIQYGSQTQELHMRNE